MSAASTRNVLLTGRVPLWSVSEVFETVAEVVGPAIKRIPDGELGERAKWIMGQIPNFSETPGLRRLQRPKDSYGADLPTFELQPGFPPQKLRVGKLRYADWAIESYGIFSRLKAEGKVRPEQKLQIGLPTPVSFLWSFIEPKSQKAFEAAVQERLIAELTTICASIPHDELAIQWDVCGEFLFMGGRGTLYVDNLFDAVTDRTAWLGAQVPADVEVGFHLCYGSHNGKHGVPLNDLKLCVEVANAIIAKIGRPVNWLHMAVPQERDDEAYFQPLRDLTRSPELELYLGLVHHTDGVEGGQRRMRTAAKFWPDFGISTECGLAYVPRESLHDVLKLHRTLAASG